MVRELSADRHWPIASTDCFPYHAAFEPRSCLQPGGALLMKTKGEAFAGLSVAIVTPFKGGDIDFDTFRAQIEFQIAAGTTCICPVGTTGESPTLSHEEQDRVIAFVVD